VKKWLEAAEASLKEALAAAESGSVEKQNLYMLAPILYSKKQNMNNEALIQEMTNANDEQVARDWSYDENSKRQYKFHYVSSYLYCFVVAGKLEELKYDEIMEYICSKMDLFTDDYTGE
jgi:hypothetical protein